MSMKHVFFLHRDDGSYHIKGIQTSSSPKNAQHLGQIVRKTPKRKQISENAQRNHTHHPSLRRVLQHNHREKKKKFRYFQERLAFWLPHLILSSSSLAHPHKVNTCTTRTPHVNNTSTTLPPITHPQHTSSKVRRGL